ncbi:MAG: conserved rane protein of unknown function [Parcubacteria group bacterium]|nr:conserved rane protein of unknown function [Parcubacteria group bacterium]
MMKHIFPIALVIVAGILGTVYLTKSQEPDSFAQQETSQVPQPIASSSMGVSANNSGSASASSGEPKQPVTATPEETTPPVTSGYTSVQVAAHADASSCWTTIGGKVYDLTLWVKQHPGGSRAILSLCGHDGTAAFEREHGGQARPEQELASFFIGNLSS